jgi:hypothetical protein
MSENGTIGKGMRLRECEVVYRSRLIDVVVRRASSREDVYRLFGSLGTTGRAAESLWVVLLDTRGKLLAVDVEGEDAHREPR